jgi:hypothetical protein
MWFKRYDSDVEDFTSHSSARRALLKFAALLGPGALGPHVLSASQSSQGHPGQTSDPADEFHLPSGKLQRDAILKDDYDHNIKDARELIDLSRSFELDLEKSDANVLSLDLLKKLDEIEKITKRIRGRMRH